MNKWEAIAWWLAEQCAENVGCSDEGCHPCEEDCAECWIRRAAKEIENEGRFGADRA